MAKHGSCLGGPFCQRALNCPRPASPRGRPRATRTLPWHTETRRSQPPPGCFQAGAFQQTLKTSVQGGGWHHPPPSPLHNHSFKRFAGRAIGSTKDWYWWQGSLHSILCVWFCTKTSSHSFFDIAAADCRGRPDNEPNKRKVSTDRNRQLPDDERNDLTRLHSALEADPSGPPTSK